MKHSYRPGADPFGLFCTMALVVMLWGCIDPPPAEAGHRVRRARVVCPPHVAKVVRHVAPYFQSSLAYVPAVQYMIGAGLRQAAVEEFSYRDELQQLRAYKQGVEVAAGIAQAAIAQAQQQAPDMSPDMSPDTQWPQDDIAAQGQQWNQGPPQQPPMQPQQQMVQPNTMSPMLAPFASQFPTIVAACGNCHREGGKAADFVRLDGSRNVLDPAECQLREEMFRRMLSTHPEVRMPPNQPLTEEAMSAIVFELYGGGEPQ